MSMKLIKGSYEYREQIIDMLREGKEYNDTHDVNRSPGIIFKNNYDDFDYYLNNLETREPKDGMVPDSTFFCLDEECKKMGIKKVLMVCDKDNIGSAKSIIKNGGILENEQTENGKTEQRYWIDLE